MNLPVFMDVMYVKPDGFLTPAMQDYNDNLNQTLRAGLSDDGWTLPQVTATELVAIEPSMPNGTMWYETTNDEVVVKVAGALRKVTTTAYP